MLVTTGLAVILFTIPFTIEGLECYTCSNVTHLAECNNLTVCQPGEVCHSEFSTVNGVRRYFLGCKSSSSCPPYPTASPGSSSIVGHSVSAQDDHCSECCEPGLCNRQLCQNNDPTCVDKTDCSATGSFSNICDHVDHIKNVCKRYCGLCTLVDGGWSQWNLWSACDRSCENGTMSRTRVCNNPAPSNGGATCVGCHKETESCNTNRQCPVHGGWSQWSPWGICSATCDIGMQRRDRSCSQPYPAYGGDQCYGDGRDDRLCLPGACADGHWSSWGPWGSCSKSCDGGLRKRSRHCDNPAPSIIGKTCVGDSFEVKICNISTCQGPVVYYARDLTTYSPGKIANLIFPHVVTNEGNAYNSHTGIFTAPTNGTYSFSLQFCPAGNAEANVELLINGVMYQTSDARGDDYSCRTLFASALLKQGDKVHARSGDDTTSGTAFYSNTDDSRITSFSGVLVMRI